MTPSSGVPAASQASADGASCRPQNETFPASAAARSVAGSASACAKKPSSASTAANASLRQKGHSTVSSKQSGTSPLSGKRETKGTGLAPCIDVPECVEKVCPELYRESLALRELQHEMDEAVEHLVTNLRDACYPSLHTSSRIVLPTLLSRRRLRVFIYNTHEHQPPAYSAFEQHAPQPDALSASLAAAALANAQSASAEGGGPEKLGAQVALDDGKKGGCPPPVESSDVHTPPPSWCLYIKAVSMEKQDTAVNHSVGGPGSSVFTPRFSSFFSRVMILTPEETVVWDSRTTGSLAASLFDGLSIHRKGSREMPLKILFFINYRTPTFRLSEPLSALCGGKQQMSLCGVLRAIWTHVMANDLLLSEAKSEKTPLDSKDSSPSAASGEARKSATSTVDPAGILYARTDAVLQAVFGAHVEHFCFADLPRLLRSQLLPPSPVCISHPLKLRGDWIDNEQAYEFTLECLDTAGAGWSACSAGQGGASASLPGGSAVLWASAVETLLQNMATSCCVLGLDPWLSSQQQVLQQLSSQTQLQQLQLASAACLAPKANQAPAQRRGRGEEQTEDEQALLQHILRVQQRSDEVDQKLREEMEKLQQRVMYLNLYKGFANNPLAFLNQQLSQTLPDISEALLDEDFVYDYNTRQRTAAYYTSPWVPRAVQRYLQKRNVSYEDQVCKVLSSFNIPDPRKRQRENADGASGSGQGTAGSAGASSRPVKPRTGGTGPASGGASSSHRPRPTGGTRHVKKKEEPQMSPGSSASPSFPSGAAGAGGFPSAAAAAGGPAHDAQSSAGAATPEPPALGVSGDLSGVSGSGFVAPGGVKPPAHLGPPPSQFAVTPVMPGGVSQGLQTPGVAGPHGPGNPARPAGPYHQTVGRVETGRRPPMGMGVPGVYTHGPMGGGIPMQMMQPQHGLMAGGGMGASWTPAGPQGQGMPPHMGPGQFWTGAGMHPGAPDLMRPGGHMG
ncbi:putative RSC6/BAF60A-like with A SWIB domain, related protein [Toxoplasma gondii MAS]|uniref:Putative RSC6/BAF60A-like with A SWIB domain, related protein n=1 Tax=Toxoplasma gondii MAS TaxID=943118 RepID=A0A086QTV2_TOXGO|nr:putative RSC6/BAF60A-like with A SWIB domain, related protein [Toxoplasma gondii MAS]